MTDEKLRKSLEELTSHGLKIEDIFPEVSKLLNKHTLDGLIYKVDNTCLKFDDGRFYTVRFFGKKVKTKEEGILQLAEILNKKSKEYRFLGTLAPSIALPLATGEYMVLSYILLNEEDCLKLDLEIKTK